MEHKQGGQSKKGQRVKLKVFWNLNALDVVIHTAFGINAMHKIIYIINEQTHFLFTVIIYQSIIISIPLSIHQRSVFVNDTLDSFRVDISSKNVISRIISCFNQCFELHLVIQILSEDPMD